MAKKKNIDTWNHYQALISQREKAFIDKSIGEIKPEMIYRVHPSGKIDECYVTEYRYCDFYSLRFFTGKRPTDDQVKQLIAHYEANPEMVIEKIGVNHYYYWSNNNKASSCELLYDDSKNQNLFTDKTLAETCAAERSKAFKEAKEFDELHKKTPAFDYNSAGYKFLGWQNGWKHVYFDDKGNVTDDSTKRKSFGYTKEDYPEYGQCRELKHRTITVHHNQRGSENTVSCPVCKIYWKYDSSD